MLIPLCPSQYLLNFTPALLYLSWTALTSDSSWNWTLAVRALPVYTSPLAIIELGPCLKNATCSSYLYPLCLLVWYKRKFLQKQMAGDPTWEVSGKRKHRQSHGDGRDNIHSVCVGQGFMSPPAPSQTVLSSSQPLSLTLQPLQTGSRAGPSVQYASLKLQT